MENKFWFRHFLVCNALAKEMCAAKGWEVTNFAQLIIEEENGMIGNEQMTTFFWSADSVLSDLSSSDAGEVFFNIEDEQDKTIEDIAAISDSDLKKYYNDFVVMNFIKR